MSTGRYRLTESAYIGEELFTDAAHELERQCDAVRHAEERKLQSREQALETFEVTPEQYTAYLARNTSHILWPYQSSWTDNVISLQALTANLEEFASHQDQAKTNLLKHLSTALRAMRKAAHAAGDESRNATLADR